MFGSEQYVLIAKDLDMLETNFGQYVYWKLLFSLFYIFLSLK